ncbi:MAG: amidohydrolase family protein, partial [Limosilactobacillus sp.]
NQLTNVLKQFAPLTNVSVDISAIQDILGEGRDDFPYKKSQWAVRLAKKYLGAKRIIWGSDAPWSATFNSYHQLATWLEHTDIFTAAELADVMANNAARIYFKPASVAAARQANDPALAQFKAAHPGTVD